MSKLHNDIINNNNFYRYYINNKKEVWKEVKDTEEDIKKVVENGARYMTTHAICGAPNQNPMRRGDLCIDFDAKNPAEAIQEMRIVDKTLKETYENIHIKYYLSGGKGCHLVIPFECCGIEANRDLHLIQKRLVLLFVEKLELKTVDLTLYAGKKGKMFRIENVLRENGETYKVQITSNELHNLSVEELNKLTYAPRYNVFDASITKIEKNELLSYHLTEIDKIIKRERKELEEKREQKQNIELSQVLKGKIPDCINAIVNIKCGNDKINFNKLCTILSTFFKDNNVSLDSALNIVSTLIRDYDSNTYKTEEAREKAFIHNYNYICGADEYEFNCGYVKSLRLNGNLFECKECVVDVKADEIEYVNDKTVPKQAREFLKKYLINDEHIKKYNICYDLENDKGYLTIPFYYKDHIVGYKYVTKERFETFSEKFKTVFYNYDKALNSNKNTLIITDDILCSISLNNLGFDNNVSLPVDLRSIREETSILKHFITNEIKNNYDKYIFMFADNEEGLAFEKELVKHLKSSKCYKVTYPANISKVRDIIVGNIKDKKQTIRDLIKNANECIVDNVVKADDKIELLEQLYFDGLQSGFKTGIECIDEYFTVKRGQMTIVTGSPSSGKSNFLDAVAINMYKEYGIKTAFCSPEHQPVERHLVNLVEKYLNKPFSKNTYNKQRLTHKELTKTIEELKNGLFFMDLDDEEGLTLDKILATMHTAIKKYDVNCIVLDPWNELEYSRPTGITETEYVSLALGKIRRFARLNKVHVFIVAHPAKLYKNKNNKTPVPNLYSISGSAHFYNKTDNGLTLHRTDDDKVNYINRTYLYIQKIKFKECGKIGCVELKFDRDTGNYEEYIASNNENRRTEEEVEQEAKELVSKVEEKQKKMNFDSF